MGLLTYLLYGMNINAILQNEQSINLGAVYESVVAQELRAHGYELYYYDNKKKVKWISLSMIPASFRSYP